MWRERERESERQIEREKEREREVSQENLKIRKSDQGQEATSIK